MVQISGTSSVRALIAACGLLTSAGCLADSLDARTVLEDAKLYFTAPARWDGQEWMYFGGTLLAVGVAHEYDDNVRAHFAGRSHAADPGKDPHGLQQALPAIALLAGTWASAARTHDDGRYAEGWSMLEAGGLSATSALALKYAFGRERPNDTPDVDAWREGADSYPSMHTTIAFAVGSVLAESGESRYRWVRRTLGYGVAGATAYLRLRDNVHWLSDTVTGAALGIASARFVLNRRNGAESRASMQIAPIDGGLLLTYSVPLH